MALPTWSSGEVLTAADVNSYFVPLAAIKTSDESVTSSATIQSDDELFVTPEISSSYFLQAYIWYQAGTTGHIQWDWGVPTGAFIRYQAFYSGAAGGFGAKQTLSATDISEAEGTGAGNDLAISMIGTLKMGTTSGNVVFKWAQKTSNGTATIVKAQSAILLTRIA